jgi:signal transduction histidine kinase
VPDAVAVLDAMPECAAILDAEGTIAARNEAWRRGNILGGGDDPRYLDACEKDSEDGVDIAAGIRAVLARRSRRFERVYHRADDRWFVLRVTPMGSGAGALVVHRDITVERRTDERNARMQQDLQAAQSIARLGSWTYDARTHSESWSKELFQILDFPPGDPPPFDDVLSRLHPDERLIVERLRTMVLTTGAAISVDVRTDPARKPLRHLQMSFVRETAPGTLLLHGTVLDVTRRKQIEEELRANEERHARLWERVMVAQDEERRRIALELHDQAGSAMASLLVGCKVLERTVSLDDARERAHRLAGDIEVVLDELARLARGLHPVALDEMGLGAALERSAVATGGLHALEVEVDVDVGTGVSRDVELALFRIAQEAMTNVVNHAAAERVGITCRREGEELVLVISDDGAGFDPSTLTAFVRKGRLGLAGIRDRAALLGGEMRITSHPGEGTILEIRVPVRPTLRQRVE